MEIAHGDYRGFPIGTIALIRKSEWWILEITKGLFELLRDSHNLDTSTWTNEMHELHSDPTASTWYDLLGFESQFTCNDKKFIRHP